jgi:hypothetical protein
MYRFQELDQRGPHNFNLMMFTTNKFDKNLKNEKKPIKVRNPKEASFSITFIGVGFISTSTIAPIA